MIAPPHLICRHFVVVDNIWWCTVCTNTVVSACFSFVCYCVLFWPRVFFMGMPTRSRSSEIVPAGALAERLAFLRRHVLVYPFCKSLYKSGCMQARLQWINTTWGMLVVESNKFCVDVSPNVKLFTGNCSSCFVRYLHLSHINRSV